MSSSIMCTSVGRHQQQFSPIGRGTNHDAIPGLKRSEVILTKMNRGRQGQSRKNPAKGNKEISTTWPAVSESHSFSLSDTCVSLRIGNVVGADNHWYRNR